TGLLSYRYRHHHRWRHESRGLPIDSRAANPANLPRSNQQSPREIKNIRLFDYANLSLTLDRRVSMVCARKTGLSRRPAVADAFYGERSPCAAGEPGRVHLR